MALRLPATVDVEAAPGIGGAAGRHGGRDTSTAATEADCCHCLVVTVDGSTGVAGGGGGGATAGDDGCGGSNTLTAAVASCQLEHKHHS